MNHGRENGRRKKPVKTRRAGFKDDDQRLEEIQASEARIDVIKKEAESDLQEFLKNRFGITIKKD